MHTMNIDASSVNKRARRPVGSVRRRRHLQSCRHPPLLLLLHLLNRLRRHHQRLRPLQNTLANDENEVDRLRENIGPNIVDTNIVVVEVANVARRHHHRRLHRRHRALLIQTIGKRKKCRRLCNSAMRRSVRVHCQKCRLITVDIYWLAKAMLRRRLCRKTNAFRDVAKSA